LRRGAVGIAHSHIDDVDARGTRLVSHLIDHGEDIGREFLYAVELLIRW
jgi:hypothetical protein